MEITEVLPSGTHGKDFARNLHLVGSSSGSCHFVFIQPVNKQVLSAYCVFKVLEIQELTDQDKSPSRQGAHILGGDRGAHSESLALLSTPLPGSHFTKHGVSKLGLFASVFQVVSCSYQESLREIHFC